MSTKKAKKVEAPQAPLWPEQAAAALGKLSGIARRNSIRAQMQARINGAQPCAPGKRRGRPAKSSPEGDVG